MPSFDIVCEVDLQEVDNAVNQASKEIGNRFDFKGGKSEVNFDKTGEKIKIIADDEMKLRAIKTMLETKFAKRGLDCRLLVYGKEEEGSGGIIRQEVSIKKGLEKEEAKKITKQIKELKLKVQPQIREDLVRVTAKKIDDLQDVMTELKANDLGLPLDYINMRS